MAQLLRNPVYLEKDEEYNCAMSESVGEVKVMTGPNRYKLEAYIKSHRPIT
jgi:hypothetical protein